MANASTRYYGPVRARPAGTRTWPAAVTLFFVAALVPETVATYNSPPLLLLTRPWTLLFLASFYGSVALLVREFMRRRPARWASVLLLGMAAGSVNEGIIAGTWYQVQYTGYAFVGGVDPAVAVGLTAFHTLYSTVLPILLVDLMFGRVAGDRWLSGKGIAVCAGLLILVTATGFGPAADRPMKAIVLAGVAVLIAIALRLPGRRNRPVSARSAPGLGRLRLVGALGTCTFFAVFAIIPGILGAKVPAADLGAWQAFYVMLMIAFFGLVVAVGRAWSGRADWGDRQTLAVITGALLPAIALSVVLPPALRELEPLVTLPMLGMLGWLARRLRPGRAPGPAAAPGSGSGVP